MKLLVGFDSLLSPVIVDVDAVGIEELAEVPGAYETSDCKFLISVVDLKLVDNDWQSLANESDSGEVWSNDPTKSAEKIKLLLEDSLENFLCLY